MTLAELLQSIGVDPTVLVAGGGGGALRALSRKRLRFRELVLSPLCGALAAAYLTLPVVHYVERVGWPLPSEPIQAILAAAFLIGTSAMWISDFVFDAVTRWFRGPASSD